MLNDINIKINGFTSNLSEKVVKNLSEILKKYSFLDFRRFNKIIITSNFQKEINSLTLNSNSRTIKNTYSTSNEAFAIVLTIPKKNDFELVMVIRSQFIKNILEQKHKKAYKKALHVIHHELAHIHDNNKKIDVFKDLMQNNPYRGANSVLYPIAESCWSEYIANFISSKSAEDTDYPKIMAKALAVKIKQTNLNIKNELMAYKINNKREDLIKSSISQIESLLKSASYLIGYLNGLKISLEHLDPYVDYEIEVSYFKDIWEVLKYELSSIHQVYPYGFVNLNIYKNLAFYIDSFFNQMGIILDSNEKKQLQIHIM